MTDIPPTDPPKIDHALDDPHDPHRFFLLTLAFEASLAVVAAAIGWLFGFNPLATWRWAWVDVAWGMLATLPLVVALWFMDRYPFGPLIRLRQLVRETVVPLFRGMTLWQLAVIALAAGVGEEMLFRGLLQGGVDTLFARWLSPQMAMAAALLAASVLFGLMHMISVTYAVLCFVMGLYLGGVWLATGNLLTPVLVHGLYDLAALAYLLRENK